MEIGLHSVFSALKPHGTAFLNVPVDVNSAVTFENPAYNTDNLRLKYYGQCGHVRKYGLDYADRLKDAGFDVTCIRVGDYFSKAEMKTYSLLANEMIYRATV